MLKRLNVKERNPLVVTPKGNFIQTIGDTHLGRVFKTDVPLSRRGEYEERQFEVLEDLLSFVSEDIPDSKLIRTQVGDWFDKATVSTAAVFRSKRLLEHYAAREKDKKTRRTPLFIISGNHDDAKNISDITSWDLLADSLSTSTFNGAREVLFVNDRCIHTFPNGEEVLFVGWNITKNAVQVFTEARAKGYRNITTVVCHLDKTSYGNDDNVIPYEFFKEHGVQLVISGHEHKPYYFQDENLEVVGTGSLLPYSHAEDDGENIYLTFTSLEEFQSYVETNDVTYSHVRLILDEADQLKLSETPLADSLSLKVVKKGVDLTSLDAGDDAQVTQVSIESYDPRRVWANAVVETELDPDVAELTWQEIQAKNTED